jgi:hypothetical protein
MRLAKAPLTRQRRELSSGLVPPHPLRDSSASLLTPRMPDVADAPAGTITPTTTCVRSPRNPCLRRVPKVSERARWVPREVTTSQWPAVAAPQVHSMSSGRFSGTGTDEGK